MDALDSTEMPAQRPAVASKEPRSQEILSCCKSTIDAHAAFNVMMVCPICKQIIKIFDDTKAYKNYQRFCASRHRRITAGDYAGRHIVSFSSYDTFSA